MDGGAYTSEARSWSDTPPGGQELEVVLLLAGGGGRAEGRLPVIGELMSGGLISYQGNQQRGTPLTAPLISSQQLGQVCRKVSLVSRV